MGNPEAGWTGGFDVVLGNPPWERIKLQEKEWFAGRRPDIANAPNASNRRKMIDALKDEDATLYNAFTEDRRKAEGETNIVRNSGRYPLCGRGDINTYAVFAETKRLIISPFGRVGCIVPSGIATDDTTKYFFQDLIEKKSLINLYDFENREGIFQGVHRSYKFCLLTLSGSAKPFLRGADFVFFAYSVQDLNDPRKRFSLTVEDITLLNPNTKTCPVFRTNEDARITKEIYKSAPPFLIGNSSQWLVQLGTLFHSSNDAHRFKQLDDLLEAGWNFLEDGTLRLVHNEAFPLYEGKMFTLFDHRAATVTFSSTATVRQRQSRDTTLDEHIDPLFQALPFFYVQRNNLTSTIWPWILCFKKVTSPTNERTLISTLLPRCVANDSVHLLFPTIKNIDTGRFLCLQGIMSSFVLDYVVRQKLGGVNLNFYIFGQLPIPSPLTIESHSKWDKSNSYKQWIVPRILELTYTAWDMEPLAKDCGYNGPPFRWDEDRRFLLRCELDAAYFHLYEIERDDVDYIMETFPIVKRKDEKCGEFRTKRVILEIFDAMAEAIRSGAPYQTRLDPPPADPRVAHPPQNAVEQVVKN